MLFNTIQKSGPFLSDPQGTHIKHLTIKTILRSLELIEEILQPVRDFTDLREADSLIRTNFRIFMREPWNYQYHDELNKTMLVRNITINQQDLEQVFHEEHLPEWGTQGQVDEASLKYMDRLHQAMKDIFDQQHDDPRFKEWLQRMDVIRREPEWLQYAYQLHLIRVGY